MTLNEAIESKRGLPYAQAFDELRAETVSTVGAIRDANLRDVVSILASGLQYRLDTMALPVEVEPLRTALLTGFKYMTLPDYAFNLAMPEVMGMLLAGVQVGLVTETEKDKFIGLATYKTAKYPELTLKDILAYFEPALIDDQWHELPVTDARTFVVRLATALPEKSNIVIQMQDQYSESEASDWYHATALHGLNAVREYTAALPHNGYPRKLRYKCDYVLNAAVSVR